VIVIFPGIGGASDWGYIKYLAKFFNEQSSEDNLYVTAIVVPRGAGTNNYSSTQFADPSATEDWREAMNFIFNKLQKLDCDYKIFGLGISMGANLLLRY